MTRLYIPPSTTQSFRQQRHNNTQIIRPHPVQPTQRHPSDNHNTKKRLSSIHFRMNETKEPPTTTMCQQTQTTIYACSCHFTVTTFPAKTTCMFAKASGDGNGNGLSCPQQQSQYITKVHVSPQPCYFHNLLHQYQYQPVGGVL